MSQTYLKLNFEKIEELYPKAVNHIVVWFSERDDIINGLHEVEGKAEKYTKDQIIGIMRQIVPTIIQHDPRKLYEPFDQFGIIISVAEHPDSTTNSPLFSYWNSRTRESNSKGTRMEAERSALEDAFKLMETELTS